MGKSVIDKNTLLGIANAIREQEGSDEPIKVEDFAERIRNLVGGESTMSFVEYTPIKDAPMLSGSTAFSFDHGLGVTPNLIIILNTSLIISDKKQTLWFLFYQSLIETPLNMAFQGYGGGNAIGEFINADSTNMVLNETSITFSGYYSNKTTLRADQIYEFIFVKV